MLTLLCTSAEMNIASWYLNTHFSYIQIPSNERIFQYSFQRYSVLDIFHQKKTKKKQSCTFRFSFFAHDRLWRERETL